MYVHKYVTDMLKSLHLYIHVVESKKALWKCHSCCTSSVEDMVMCDGCESLFHW